MNSAVESTTLATVAYDKTREPLLLQFRTRTLYQYCGVPAPVHEGDGRFVVKRKTQSKRLTAKFKSFWTQARRRMHTPVRDQHPHEALISELEAYPLQADKSFALPDIDRIEFYDAQRRRGQGPKAETTECWIVSRQKQLTPWVR